MIFSVPYHIFLTFVIEGWFVVTVFHIFLFWVSE